MAADALPKTIDSPELATPPPAIFDLGTVRLGSGSIAAEFPPRSPVAKVRDLP